jgi:hypothetical protein
MTNSMEIGNEFQNGDFLIKMQWLKENTDGQLEITEWGKTWISRCHFVIR